MKSWQTTLAGILAAVSILCAQGSTLVDNDPKTNPSFSEIIGALGLFGIGLFARDNSVTSEEAGAK